MMIVQTNEATKYPIKLEVKTVKSDSYVSFVSNRIYGGARLGNLFELSFILEHPLAPDNITIEIDEKGKEKELPSI